MPKTSRVSFPHIPERLGGLPELAYNLWWSWHPEARMLFKMLDRAGWKLSVHNPIKMLRDCRPEVYTAAVADEALLGQYDRVMSDFRTAMKTGKSLWLDDKAEPGAYAVAFFSAEYGLHHSLPFYAGGLGFLAGDLLKEASDLGLPVVALGFMYPGGYLRQRVTPDGWQVNDSEPLEREHAPIVRVLDDSGSPLSVEVPFIAPAIRVGVWLARVGRVSLYLLDTDIEANDPWNRGISAHLYTGDRETRLRQEIILGIGGSQVLRTLGIKHVALHLNEGHSAFAVFERVRERVASGASFQEAFAQVRATTVFTTHTPVPAGHDVFPFAMMEKYFCECWPSLGLERESFFQLGVDPAAPSAGFNMTALALRASAYHNGVSRKHARVARRMWKSLWPKSPEQSVPIEAVTNGIHVPTWIEPKMQMLLDRHLGAGWLARHDDPLVWKGVDDIPDEELWKTHYWLKTKLIMRILDRARERYMESADSRVILASGVLLDPNVLTIGFARRFTTYKRAGLILRDPARLKRLVSDRWRPVQIIFAGKAHPDDEPAKLILQKVFRAAADRDLGGRVAFVEDYDEQFAQYMVHGVDVWLNNPQPPLEACGTSGMKAMLNGVVHLSVPDGWWPEGFNGRNGWSFGSDEGAGDDADASSLYKTLDEEVIPAYYQVDDGGVPRRWVRLMKESIKSAAAFSARRMVKEYATRFYREALKIRGQDQ